jgi:hypothetical protein
VPGHLLLKNCVEDQPTRPAIERALMFALKRQLVDMRKVVTRGWL